MIEMSDQHAEQQNHIDIAGGGARITASSRSERAKPSRATATPRRSARARTVTFSQAVRRSALLRKVQLAAARARRALPADDVQVGYCSVDASQLALHGEFVPTARLGGAREVGGIDASCFDIDMP